MKHTIKFKSQYFLNLPLAFLENNIWSNFQCLSNNESSYSKYEDKGPTISQKSMVSQKLHILA